MKDELILQETKGVVEESATKLTKSIPVTYKTVGAAILAVLGILGIVYICMWFGYSNCEKELKPSIDELERRVKKMEKNQTNH